MTQLQLECEMIVHALLPDAAELVAAEEAHSDAATAAASNKDGQIGHGNDHLEPMSSCHLL